MMRAKRDKKKSECQTDPAPTERPPEVATEGEPDDDGLRAETDAEQRLAELDAKYRRALADYQNFQRRSIDNERRARESGRVEVVERLIPMLEHFRLGMQMDPASTTAEAAIGGMRAIFDEFTRAMASFGVTEIAPAVNDEFDPGRHEAMLRAEAEGVEPGRVAQLLQSGWALGERVVRPAKVSVAPGDEGNADEEPAPGTENNGDDDADQSA